MVAAGRKPNLGGLGLDAAGIVYSDKGIEVDDRLRTSNRRVFAIGDVAGGAQFTHMAGHHAGIVIRNALFRMPAKARNRGVPRVTYTDPEIAHAGLSEAEARAAGEAEVRTVTWSFEENDRARAERETEGLVKAVLGRRGRILGAGIVGPRAGELIAPWVLGIEQRLKIGAIADMIVPYPTLAEVSKRRRRLLYRGPLQSPDEEDRLLPVTFRLTGGHVMGDRDATLRAPEKPGLLRRLAPLGLIGLALALIFVFNLDRFLTFEALRENRALLTGFVADHMILAALAFTAIYAVATALSVPGGLILSIAGGFLFGSILATGLIVVGATLGALAIFLAARSAFGDLLRTRAGTFITKLDAGFRENAFSYLLVLRLVPLFPLFVVNLVPAFLEVRTGVYTAATFLGIIPGSFVFALVGAGLDDVLESTEAFSPATALTPEAIGALVGLAALSLLPLAYKVRLRGGPPCPAPDDFRVSHHLK